MENNVTRKDFLLKTSKAAVGVTAIAGLSSLITTASKANAKVTPWPWPYIQLDAEAARIQAHYLYYNGMACCAGTFGGITSALATAIGDPWTNLPMEIMSYGSGGGNGWGVISGCLNGDEEFINLVKNKAQCGPFIAQ